MALEVRIENEDVAPEVLQGMEQTAVAEDELVGEFQPRGNFTRKPLNALVVQAKKGQPLYGLKADYPNFPEDQTELPIEFVRLLLMFKQSIDDAIVADVLDEEDTFVLEDWYGNKISLPTTTTMSLMFSTANMIKAVISFNVLRIHINVSENPLAV